MTQPKLKYHRWQPIIKKLISKRPVVWVLSRTMHHLDRFAIKISDGEHTAASVLSGLPIVTLTTTGARSGRLRSVPLVGFPDGDNYVFIASNWGQSAHPSWYYNLRANPTATITCQGMDKQVVAHEATGAERELCWMNAVAEHSGYAAYEQQAHGRSIPIMVCVPQTP